MSFFYDESQPTRKSVLMVFPWHTIDSSDHENSDVATKRTVSSRDLRQEKTYASVEYTKDEFLRIIRCVINILLCVLFKYSLNFE